MIHPKGKKATISLLLAIGLFWAAICEATEPSARELILAGNKLCEEGKYAQAIEKYKLALERYNSPDAAYNLGVTYEIDLHDMEQALYYYNRFLNLEPDTDDARNVRRWIKEIKAAYPFLGAEKASSIEELPPQTRALVIEEMKAGHQSYREGKYQQALEHFQRVLEVVDSADVYYNLARTHEKLGNKGQAIRYYLEFLALEPNSPSAEEVRQWIRRTRAELRLQGGKGNN